MNSSAGSLDHRENEFYSYRYTTRFQKGDIVEIRSGLDLEAARFQARKSFPDVLNEYWWLKPSDVQALKDLPLKITDIYFYHGGVPVLVLLTANGTLARKAQIFLKRRDESRADLGDHDISPDGQTPDQLGNLLVDPNLYTRLRAAKVLADNFPDYKPHNDEQRVVLNIINGNYPDVTSFGAKAIEHLIERLFVTSNAKETERIIDSFIEIGAAALPRLDDIVEFLSLMASPYYAKRINWTIGQIKKNLAKNGLVH